MLFVHLLEYWQSGCINKQIMSATNNMPATSKYKIAHGSGAPHKAPSKVPPIHHFHQGSLKTQRFPRKPENSVIFMKILKWAKIQH